MPCCIYFENNFITNGEYTDVSSLKYWISKEYVVDTSDLYVTINGTRVSDDLDLTCLDKVVRITPRLVGGKGGFGSMLRAIGAQIEKTTNREACRDLSGRRLRDINEEKRLRKWLDGQEERDREAVERKQKKLERLLAEPKINVNLAPSYEKERQDLPGRVSAAVDAGWQAAGSSNTGTKRKAEDDGETKGKKKSKLWIDADLSDCSMSSDEDDIDDDKEITKTAKKTTSDSGNESDIVSESNSKD